jgi:hypothetical protein
LRTEGRGTPGLITTNRYDRAGDLCAVRHPAGTPGLTNSHDRLGRLAGVSRNGINTRRACSDA